MLRLDFHVPNAMHASDYDYPLPRELIAQHPPAERGDSRMMVLDRATRAFQHRHIRDLPEFLAPGDLLVLNDTRVIPARLRGTWHDTGGGVEILLLERADDDLTWHILFASTRKARAGQRMDFAPGFYAELLPRDPDAPLRARFNSQPDFWETLSRHGETPLPPYIKRAAPDPSDAARYQTVYAREPGAVAAPTAGLHFTDTLFTRLESRGVRRAFVTLHVGAGTFKPVTAERVEDHAMHPERYEISPAAVASVEACHKAGRRVIAVGSTSVRALESASNADGGLAAGSGESSIFIYPPHAFKNVDAILTNFHLPRSTLLMMMSAFAGREFMLEAYAEAVREKYRFFSYGDCMLIL